MRNRLKSSLSQVVTDNLLLGELLRTAVGLEHLENLISHNGEWIIQPVFLNWINIEKSITLMISTAAMSIFSVDSYINLACFLHKTIIWLQKKFFLASFFKRGKLQGLEWHEGE